MAILDLGVGPGHFPFVCRYLGHDVLGTDIEPLARTGTGPHAYDVLLELFEVPKVSLRVERRQELPSLGRRFDLVSALMVTFDHPESEVPWTAEDWLFFLRDVATRQLTPDGRLFLSLNRPFATPEILQLMLDQGAAVDKRKCTVRFDSVEALR